MNQTIEFTDQGLALFKDFEKEAFIVGGYYGGLPTVALKVITSWAYVTSRLLSFSGKLWADGDMLMGTNDFIKEPKPQLQPIAFRRILST